MKKLISLISSLALMVSAVPFAASAAESKQLAYDAEELELFERFDSGELIADVNDDGIFDVFDAYDTLVYYSLVMTGQTAEENDYPIFTVDLWNRIENYCDYTFDGVVDPMDTTVLLRYYARDNELIYPTDEEEYEHLYGEKYNESEDVVFSTIDNVEILEDKSLAGDANCDGKLTLADSVIIMQYIANPDKYPLTEQGKFNADIANTGDGITAADALEIQKILS